MPIGYIERIIQAKSIGFIRPSGTQESVFFHRASLPKHLEFTDQLRQLCVEFEIVNGPKGQRAERIRLPE